MDDKDIKSILQSAMEQEIPASQVDLLPAVKASLVAGRTSSSQQGEKMNISSLPRLQRMALTALVIAIFMTVALVTPQGRAFAQNVLQFFRRAESNVLPLPTEQIAPLEDAQAMSTAQPPAPIVSVVEAEAAAGFDTLELPSTPEGFAFAGAMGRPGGISIQYEVVGGGGALVINESTNGFMQSEWDQAPVEAISQVKIGELDAEIVQGTYVVYPGETVARWNSDAPILRLRWIENGIWFEMAKFGGVEVIEYLDREALIELADSLTNDPFPLEGTAVEAQADFDVLEPGTFPSGMTFLGAAFDPSLKIVSLSYGYSDTDRRILIKQQPVDFTDTCDLCGVVGASASVESVQIGDVGGEYALGVWELTDTGPVWRDDPYLTTIRWQKDGIAFELISMGTEVGKEDLLAMAASMK